MLLSLCLAAAIERPGVVDASVTPESAVGQQAATATDAPQTVSGREVITDIRVHGNVIVPNDDVIRLAGVRTGEAFTAGTIAEVTGRLRASKQFQDIQVLKRFASIDDPSRIALVIVVNEGPVRLTQTGDPANPIAVVRRRGVRNLMFLPILDAEDGYGLTYGARFALLGVAGPRSRVSFPLTWGGTKRAAVELDRPLATGPFTRIEAGAALQKQTNPAFDEGDARRRVWARVERTMGHVRLGGSADWQHVSFGGLEDSFRSVGADATIDTRLDPVLPRNAVYASAGWSRVNFASGKGVDRTDVDARAYIGLKGAPVLVLRVERQGADEALPEYMKPLLGGWSSLRGFAAGAFVGDTVVDGSVELRVPLTSPLHVARAGVSLFVDAGKAYDVSERFGDRPLERGTGASVWVAATALHLEIAVAHGYGHGTRVNFGAGLTF